MPTGHSSLVRERHSTYLGQLFKAAFPLFRIMAYLYFQITYIFQEDYVSAFCCSATGNIVQCGRTSDETAKNARHARPSDCVVRRASCLVLG